MHLKFFQEFIKNRKTIGAVAPSSAALARRIVNDTIKPADSFVVEYGPGTGSFTRQILKTIRPGVTFFAVENNPQMASLFQKKFPEVTLYHDSVENIPAILRNHDVAHVDCIISGLPWAAFDPELQDRLLGATLEVLRTGGVFATFTYIQSPLLPAGRQFKKKLDALFSRIETSPTVWNNLPPAFVYHCTK
ncbi:MAG: methyltransferase domain-containing protein [Planctomycetes bacterium]|nr:methyltransferase domain-containing protein [Planctomycetota bacterium]